VIPALNKIDTELRKPQILILEPTRELAMQTREEVVDLSKGLHMKSAVLYGGSWIRKQREELDAGPQIIIATPGRLIDLIERGWIDLRYIDTLIIDEVDQMMDMGFIEPVRHIWSKLRAFKQLMTFSATYSDTIMSLIRENIGTEYEMLQLQKTLTVDTIDHAFIRVSPIDKYLTAKRLISDTGAGKVIIFTKMKHETEEIARYLQRDGIEAGYLHGDLEQRDRIRTLKDYKDGHIRVFIATDIAARGLNLNNIDLVINYHVPLDPESYIHRIGRTGRAGASGKAVMLVSPDESRALMRVERTNKIKIKEVDHDGKEIERAPEYGGRSGGRSGGGGYKGGRSGGGGGYRGNNGGGRST
jgi:superfamily II DNA/RNA helicase